MNSSLRNPRILSVAALLLAAMLFDPPPLHVAVSLPGMLSVVHLAVLSTCVAYFL